MNTPPELPNPAELPSQAGTLEVHQEKGKFFRVIHADGIWCGVNAYRQIHVSFFSERFPIPRSLIYELDEKGIVKKEIGREGKTGWFRELEVDVVMSVEAARQIHKSLGDFIEVVEKAMPIQTK